MRPSNGPKSRSARSKSFASGFFSVTSFQDRSPNPRSSYYCIIVTIQCRGLEYLSRQPSSKIRASATVRAAMCSRLIKYLESPSKACQRQHLQQHCPFSGMTCIAML